MKPLNTTKMAGWRGFNAGLLLMAISYLLAGCGGGRHSGGLGSSPGATQYTFLRAFGSPGMSNGQFNEPFGVALDPSGNAFVSDSGLARITKFRPDGTAITAFKSPSSTIAYQTLTPYYLAVDSAGEIYVSVKSLRGQITSHIDKFAADGTFLSQFQPYSALNGDPTGIAVAGGLIYVAAGGLVVAYHGDGTKAFSFAPFADDTLNPHSEDGLAVDSRGDIFLADSAGHSCRKFDKQGVLMTIFGTIADNNPTPLLPTGIAVDKDDSIYVTDGNRQQIRKYTSAGALVTTFGSFGSGTSQFRGPNGIAVDANGNVYIADGGNSRVEVFQPQ